jgi:peptidoglycan/LPS O-acetylase OafA/YrhL
MNERPSQAVVAESATLVQRGGLLNPKPQTRAISRSTSVSLDILRAAAALTVFLHHANWLHLDGGGLFMFDREVGHSAVVIFFVLSGFVIAATMDRTRSGADYAIKRASRIYSVAVPALLLTFAIDLVSAQFGFAGSANYELRRPWLYMGLHLLFAGDLWSLGISAFSDHPYWSLNYEVWYYVAFGVAVFMRGAPRSVALSLVLVVMGPKLWLLFPIWLGGAAVFVLQRRVLLPRTAARVLVAVSVALGAAFVVFRIGPVVDEFGLAVVSTYAPFPLRFSQWFLGDYVLGVLTMALVYALGSAEVVLPRIVEVAATSLAKVSFSLYVVHHPLLQFFGALLPGQGPVATALALGCSLGFGAIFEPQRNRLRRVLMAATTRFA